MLYDVYTQFSKFALLSCALGSDSTFEKVTPCQWWWLPSFSSIGCKRWAQTPFPRCSWSLVMFLGTFFEHSLRSQILCQNQSWGLSVDIQFSAIILTIRRRLIHFSVFSSDFHDVGHLGDLSNSASSHPFFTHPQNDFSWHNLGSIQQLQHLEEFGWFSPELKFNVCSLFEVFITLFMSYPNAT